MARKLYALLVGVNEYLGNVPKLNGCVNDIHRMLEFLRERTVGGNFELKELVLTSGDQLNPNEALPTRQNVINGFCEHLAQAGEEDVVLFYFSGHGSQEKAPPEFWYLEPDHLNETLVLYDSRVPGSWDLADKEISVLISRVAKKNPHILVILDACHSGSGTRVADDAIVRLAPVDQRERPLDSFIPGVISAVDAQRSTNGIQRKETHSKFGGWFDLPSGRHVVISACRAEESAREKLMPGGEIHGVMTYSLLDTLQHSGPNLSYRDVFSRIDTLVRGTVTGQSPVIGATEADDLHRFFLDGSIVECLPYFNVNYDACRGWVVKGGAIHGISQPQGQETTLLALFPPGHIVKAREHMSDAVGRALVTQVYPGESCVTVEMADGSAPDPKVDSFRAVVVSTPLQKVGVYLSGDDQTAVQALGQRLKKSLIVAPVEINALSTIRVTAAFESTSYSIKLAGGGRPLSIHVENRGTPESLVDATAKLEHIGKWIQVLALENKQSRLPADAVTMEFFHYIPGKDGEDDRSEPLDQQTLYELRYNPDEAPKAALLQIKLTHTGKYQEKLFCMLLNLTEDFSITVNAALFGGGVWLNPGETQWAVNPFDNKPYIFMYIPKNLRGQGVRQVRDVMKLIVSTDASDASVLKQNALETIHDNTSRGVHTAQNRTLHPLSTIQQLMNRLQTRSANGYPDDAEVLSDWRTSQVTITTQLSGQ